MSNRKRLLTRGVFLGYGALASQIFYSLASIPLALSFLSRAEFGMWSLIATLISYLGLAELGMTNAFQRHLFECKDDKNDGRYGRFFTASLMALGMAAGAVLVFGLLGTWVAIPIYRIPEELRTKFMWVMIGQVLICSGSMATRMLSSPLYIHQRHDLSQICQIFQFGIYYFVLRYGLHAGWGLYAMLANILAGFLWSLAFNVIACLSLSLYPPRGTWGRPHADEWSSVVSYSRDYFLVQVGSQLARGMPMLLLPRLLGLEAGAVWAICTRPYFILKQLVTKPYDYSLPMLCEIYVNGEKRRMATRWTQITQLIMALTVCVFMVCAANNEHFIHLWIGRKMAWTPITDWFMANYFLVSVAAGAAFGIVGFEKHFGATRFVPFLEATLVATNAFWMTRLWGIPGLIVAATLAELAASLWFGIRHLTLISGTPTQLLLKEALWRPLRVVPFAAALAWACSHLDRFLPGYAGLVLAASMGTITTGIIALFLGVSAEVREEALQMLMRPFGPLLSRKPATRVSVESK